MNLTQRIHDIRASRRRHYLAGKVAGLGRATSKESLHPPNFSCFQGTLELHGTATSSLASGDGPFWSCPAW